MTKNKNYRIMQITAFKRFCLEELTSKGTKIKKIYTFARVESDFTDCQHDSDNAKVDLNWWVGLVVVGLN